MRSVLVDWLVEVHQQFSLLQETLFLAVAILDRYFIRIFPNSNDNLNLFPNNSCTVNNNNVVLTDISNDNDDDVPVIIQDVELEKSSYCQLKVEAHRWTVYNFFINRYEGLSPPDDVDLYTYWTGRGGVGPMIKNGLETSKDLQCEGEIVANLREDP